MFKVGDKVRRVSGSNSTTPVGFEGVIREIRRKTGESRYTYHFDGGSWGYAKTYGEERWELVAPTGPVLTETVTKTRIVPGVYDGVRVKINPTPGKVFVYIHETLLDADQLDAAAAVLSELAKGLRDA